MSGKQEGRAVMAKKMDKNEFLKSEFGKAMVRCAEEWDRWLTVMDDEAARWYQAQWNVFQMAVKQFCGVEYHFARTDEYVGICTKGKRDWLFVKER